MRSIDATLLAALKAPTVWPVCLVEMDFVSGMTRLHSGLGDLVMTDPFTGEALTFLGVGELGSISALEQPEALRSSEAELALSGVNPADVARALLEAYQGRSCRIFFGALTEDGAALAGGSAVPLVRARMDTMKFVTGRTATITLKIRNEMADWERVRASRYSNAEQKRIDVNDTGLSRIAVAAEAEIVWQV